MHFLYKELQKAIGAKLCCQCHFFSDKTDNIVTCSSDTIVIYEIVRLSSVDANKESPYRLKVVGQYSFCGEILSIATIPLRVVEPNSTLSDRDVLIFSFKGNYVSFVVFNDFQGDLCTLQYYDFNKEASIAKSIIHCSYVNKSRW